MSLDLRQLIVGPAEHGVIRHALSVAAAAGDQVVRAERPDLVDPAKLVGADVLHVSYTDRLFGDRCEASAHALTELIGPAMAAGSALSITLHDLPAGDSPLEARRRAAYAQVVAAARGVVVNSLRERALLGELADAARSIRIIPLPIDDGPSPAGPADLAAAPEVVVLGFVFPDRGYEQVIAELPAGVGLVALGRAAVGHEDLAERLVGVAATGGHAMRITGFVPDAELAAALHAAPVPLAPNRRVAASASINTWIGHGRRPLIPDSPYSRELAARAPGTVTLYDADRPGALRAAVTTALAEPETTWIDPGTRRGPTMAETVAAYAEHFRACAPPAPLAVGPGRWTVPDNRWDLLDGLRPDSPPAVSVVIPYYEAQAALDRVLRALTEQTHPAGRLQVVVADDGSARPPSVAAAGDLDVTVVRQDDRGFRAAAARNLGARAADGNLLLFLDGDTIPEPDYVERLIRLPAIAPDAMVVGRRRHADFSGASPVELTEPAWLREAYAETRDLLDADDRSYRHIISAVCGLDRGLFDELGGFSEEFTAYGGEDWELAHRAWVAGALLAHVPEAVAWHDGPDWADRGDARADKNAEILALTRLLPDPVARGGGQWLPYPAIVVTVPDPGPAGALVTARWAFRGDTDCGIWLTGPDAETTVGVLGDPRIQAGPVPTAVLDRASVLVELTGPARLEGLTGLADQARRHGELVTPAGTIRARRSVRRAQRWAARTGSDLETLRGRLSGRHDLDRPVLLDTVNLPHELKYVGQPSRSS